MRVADVGANQRVERELAELPGRVESVLLVIAYCSDRVVLTRLVWRAILGCSCHAENRNVSPALRQPNPGFLSAGLPSTKLGAGGAGLARQPPSSAALRALYYACELSYERKKREAKTQIPGDNLPFSHPISHYCPVAVFPNSVRNASNSTILKSLIGIAERPL